MIAQLLPEILSLHRQGTDESLVLALRVPSTLAHFAGHFPAMAILPGVVQIDWAVRLAGQHLPLTGHFLALENIKFQALVLPGAVLELRLLWHADTSRLDFGYTHGERKHSSGRMVFGAGP